MDEVGVLFTLVAELSKDANATPNAGLEKDARAFGFLPADPRKDLT